MASGSLFCFKVYPPGQIRNICLARKEKMFLYGAFPGGKKRDIVPAGWCVVWSRKRITPPQRGPFRTFQRAAVPVAGPVVRLASQVGQQRRMSVRQRRKPGWWKIEVQTDQSCKRARRGPCWVTGEPGQGDLSVIQEEMTQRPRGDLKSQKLVTKKNICLQSYH